MMSNKLTTLQNLCSQSNIAKSNRAILTQQNHLVIIGLEGFNSSFKDIEHVPISVKISESGELELSGIDENIINNKEKTRIYSEKKVTRSKR